MTADETSSTPRQKRRKVKQAKDFVNSESLWLPIVHNLDMLYQAQLNHQRTTTTIVGTIEKENRRLITESLEFQDSQICRLLEESDEDRCNQTRTLVADAVEDLLAQQRRLFERGLKDTEQLARTLVLALDESMEA